MTMTPWDYFGIMLVIVLFIMCVYALVWLFVMFIYETWND